MNKFLRLFAFFLLVQINTIWAQQDTLFYAPDSVCVNQPVHLSSRYANQSSYYWGFCSAYMDAIPTGTNLGSGFNFNHPGAIDIAKDKVTGNYYGFVVNTGNTELLRLNFGNSPDNVPTVTNFGKLTNGLPINPTSLFLVRDTASGYYFIFVSGGFDSATSSLARIDFGPSLSNPAPNIVNFGNLYGHFKYPKGIFIAQDTSDLHWYGYMINHGSNEMLKLDFSFNISNTPMITNLGNPSGILNVPTDMAGIFYYGQWYMFVTNAGSSSILRYNLGPNLHPPVVTGTDIGNFYFRILVPSSISLNRDCGGIYALVTDSTSNQLVNIRMGTPLGPFYAKDYADIGAINLPTGVSSIIRDRDQLYAFVCNVGDNSLSKISIKQCSNSSIPNFYEVTPPAYHYDSTADTPVVYNIYYVINEGLPNVDVQCKTITVMPKPSVVLSPNYIMCQKDTARIWAISTTADSIVWTNTYCADTTFLRRDSLKVWPDYDNWYPAIFYYPHGCIVSDSIKVSVTHVNADAGQDRTILDGAYTTLGGPNSTTGNVSYYWQPYQFMALSDTFLANPVVNPPYDYTYYLTVTELNDDLGCSATDTVIVRVVCGDFVLPNAFAPNSEFTGVNRFGIINNQITHLAYLRIYDRWGLEVFETNDPTHSWDGTYNDAPAPEGVYVYIADGFCDNGKHVHKQGNVTLLR